MTSAEQVTEAVHAKVDMQAHGRGAVVARFVRSVAFKALRPFVEHQQRVNVAVADAVIDLGKAVNLVVHDSAKERAAVLAELRRTQALLLSAHQRMALLEAVHQPPFTLPGVLRLDEVEGVGGALVVAPEWVDSLNVLDPEDRYREFEDVFRGSSSFIRTRQMRYLQWVRPGSVVVDVGCGRGEFLVAAREAGAVVRGVDLDSGMLKVAREEGLEVACQDGIGFLRNQPPASCDLVFSAQVVEHLGPSELEDLVRAAFDVLKPEGYLIIETVNPHSPAALKTFWVDRTHHHPLFPEVLLALVAQHGFASAFAFCPNGTGDYETDRIIAGEYAIVATRPSQN